MRFTLLGFASALVLAALPVQARAQSTTVGPYLAYHNDLDFGIGAFVAIPVPTLYEGLILKPDIGYYFPGDVGVSHVNYNYFELNVDAVYPIPIENESVSPFAMGGINIGHWSYDADITGLHLAHGGGTEIGINIGGGVTFLQAGKLVPSAGFKLELNGGDGFVLFGALGFPVGSGGGGM